MPNLSRRQFLKTVIVESVALSIGDLLSSCSSTSPSDDIDRVNRDLDKEVKTSLPSIYYIDATHGNDSNFGSSIDSPWKTIDKLNESKLKPGDSVLFKKGETWIGKAIMAQNGLTYGAYGDGEIPIIDGNNAVTCFVSIEKKNIRLENLTLIRGLDSCTVFNGSEDIIVSNCEMYGAGNDNLLFINGCSRCKVLRGTYHDPVQRSTSALVTCIEIADNGSDFLIDGAEVFNSPVAGISVHNHNASNPQGRTTIPSNVVIKNVHVHDNSWAGINVMAQDYSSPATISILDCQIVRNQTGVRIHKTDNSSGYFNGSLTITNCRMLDNYKYGFYISGDDVTVSRCLSAGNSQQNLVLNSKNVTLHNVTIYLSPDSELYPLYVKGERVENLTIRNSIIYMANQSGYVIGTALGSTNTVTIDYMMYFFPDYTGQRRWTWNGVQYTYTDWKNRSGQDVHSPYITNPLFVDVGQGDFTLDANSPAIDIGLNLGGGYLGTAPDIGFAELR